ncbi:hypothetical protein G9A89_004387 [Geosiphon pyriformis]|nr:hypothetical protein G9A89_004387 [Geosiphon pyriformis]
MDQLGRRVDQTASTRIIMADGVTKTPIDEHHSGLEYTRAPTQPEQATHVSTSHMWLLQGYQHYGTTNRLRERKTKTYLGSLPSIMG